MECESSSPSLVRVFARYLISVFFLISITLFPVHLRDNPSNLLHYASRVPPSKNTLIKETNIRKPARPERTSPKEKRFHAIILAASNRHQVDPALVKAIIKAESGYDPFAVSKKGAVGLMQLMPTTAYDLGVKDPFDPEHNIAGGVKYLSQLLNRLGGDLVLAIAAYNAGISNVKKYDGVPPYKATRYYVKKVLEYYHFYKGVMTGRNNRA